MNHSEPQVPRRSRDKQTNTGGQRTLYNFVHLLALSRGKELRGFERRAVGGRTHSRVDAEIQNFIDHFLLLGDDGVVENVLVVSGNRDCTTLVDYLQRPRRKNEGA